MGGYGSVVICQYPKTQNPSVFVTVPYTDYHIHISTLRVFHKCMQVHTSKPLLELDGGNNEN